MIILIRWYSITFRRMEHALRSRNRLSLQLNPVQRHDPYVFEVGQTAYVILVDLTVVVQIIWKPYGIIIYAVCITGNWQRERAFHIHDLVAAIP